MSAIEYIRERYKVPAKLGGRVRYEGKPGTITSAPGNLQVRPDERPYKSTRWYCHPTWHMEYLDNEGNVLWPKTPEERRIACLEEATEEEEPDAD